jgi:Chalcone isomerase-like
MTGSCRPSCAFVVTLVVALLMLAPRSNATQHAVVNDAVPREIGHALADARLSGQGKFTWFGLKIYDARLWVAAAGLELAQYANMPFALEIRYARSMPGKSIAEQSDKEIQALGIGGDTQRTRWLEQMVRLFPDVNDGDRLIGIHQPNQATEFWLNGNALGRVDDPQFGAAFFAIWLDPRTKAPGLRQAMLAGAARRAPQ